MAHGTAVAGSALIGAILLPPGTEYSAVVLLLTLFLVPSAYYVVDRIKERFTRRKERRVKEEMVLEA